MNGPAFRASAGIAAVTLAAAALAGATGIAAGIYWLATFDLFDARASGPLTASAEDVVRWLHFRDTSLYWIPLATFWLWLWLAYRLLESVVDDLRFSSRSALLGFVIPGLNLWRPLGVLRELWRAAERDRLGGVPWKAMPAPVTVILCWAAYSLGVLAWGYESWLDIARRQATGINLSFSWSVLKLTRYAWLFQDVATVVGASAALVILVRVTRWLQAARRRPIATSASAG